MPAVRSGMLHVAASWSSVAAPCARPVKNPISLATNKCFAAIKPMAILKIGSGVTSAMTCLPLEGIERVLLVIRTNGADRCHQCPSYVRSNQLLVTPPSDGAKDLGHGAPIAIYFN